MQDFLRSLLKQLVYQMESIPDSIVRAYDRVVEKGRSGEPDRAGLVGLLADCFVKFSTVFVVLDAFDECADLERLKIATLLQQLPQPQLRLFMTGRQHAVEYQNYCEDDFMHRWLKRASTQEISAVQTDIEKYLTEELRTKATGSTEAAKLLRSRIVMEICSQAQGQSCSLLSLVTFQIFARAISGCPSSEILEGPEKAQKCP